MSGWNVFVDGGRKSGTEPTLVNCIVIGPSLPDTSPLMVCSCEMRQRLQGKLGKG